MTAGERQRTNPKRKEGGENRGEKTEGKRSSGTNMALLVAVVETSAEEITPHLAHLSVILYSGTVI